jgi:hypothetical protein
MLSWLLYAVLVAAYLTIVKASRIRTLGYRVAGTRIVDLRGRRRPDRGRDPCRNDANRLFCFDNLYFSSTNRRGRSSGKCTVCLVRPTNWCAIEAKA